MTSIAAWSFPPKGKCPSVYVKGGRKVAQKRPDRSSYPNLWDDAFPCCFACTSHTSHVFSHSHAMAVRAAVRVGESSKHTYTYTHTRAYIIE